MNMTGIVVVEKGIYGRTSPKVSGTITGNIYNKNEVLHIVSIESDGIRKWAKLNNNEYVLLASNNHRYIKINNENEISTYKIENTMGVLDSATTTQTDRDSTASDEEQQHQSELEEKKAKALLASLGIDYDAITMEQFVNSIEVLKLSKHLKTPISQRGKTTMTHGKGKRKRK